MIKRIKRTLCLLMAVTMIFGMQPLTGEAAEINYLAIGDSISTSYELSEGEQNFTEILTESHGYVLNNQAIVGYEMIEVLANLQCGVLDEAIKDAEVITLTCGGNDLMAVLYYHVADNYNKSYNANITAEDVPKIFMNSSDSRYYSLLLTAYGSITSFTESLSFKVGLLALEANLTSVMDYIFNINENVVVIMPTQYNPYKDFSNTSFGNIYTEMDEAANAMNSVITKNASVLGYITADVYSEFQASDVRLCNATCDPINLDFHPNAEGHKVIAETIAEVIPELPEESVDPIEPVEPEKPIGPETPIELPFTDVSEADWFYDAVVYAYDNNITKGKTETEFEPYGTCTRAEAVTFLWRACGSPTPETTTNPFTDVEAGRFYYDAVLWAVEKGITKGTTETRFSPDALCTRGHVVTFLNRALGGAVNEVTENPFADIEEGRFYYDAVLWAVEEGIAKGTTETRFSPADSCTRGQIVTFIHRALTENN